MYSQFGKCDGAILLDCGLLWSEFICLVCGCLVVMVDVMLDIFMLWTHHPDTLLFIKNASFYGTNSYVNVGTWHS